MSIKEKNDWELDVDTSKYKEKNDYNLDNIYEHAHSELSLQQSKRDQVITIYLALCSFLLPFSLGEQVISVEMKGLIFTVLSLVGILFSFITIRYREYKEIYWICCQTITVLQSFKAEEINKSLIQRTFYRCLYKKGKGLLMKKGESEILSGWRYAKKNIYSSETLHFLIIDLMASFILGLGIALLLEPVCSYNVLIAVAVAVLALFTLLFFYFRACFKIYLSLQSTSENFDSEKKNLAFNKAFSKAWFLHFYY